MKLLGRGRIVEFQGENRSGFQRFQCDVTRLRQTNVRGAVDDRVPQGETRAEFGNDQPNRTRSAANESRSIGKSFFSILPFRVETRVE